MSTVRKCYGQEAICGLPSCWESWICWQLVLLPAISLARQVIRKSNGFVAQDEPRVVSTQKRRHGLVGVELLLWVTRCSVGCRKSKITNWKRCSSSPKLFCTEQNSTWRKEAFASSQQPWTRKESTVRQKQGRIRCFQNWSQRERKRQKLSDAP